MEYVTMFSFTRQYQELGISFTLLQGAYDFLWLENIARVLGKKMEFGNILGEVCQKLFRVKLLLMWLNNFSIVLRTNILKLRYEQE
jgi:hypothetical protein